MSSVLNVATGSRNISLSSEMANRSHTQDLIPGAQLPRHLKVNKTDARF